MIALFSGRLDRNESLLSCHSRDQSTPLPLGLAICGQRQASMCLLIKLEGSSLETPILWVGLKVPWVEVQEWGVSKWILRRRNGERENTPLCMVLSDPALPVCKPLCGKGNKQAGKNDDLCSLYAELLI